MISSEDLFYGLGDADVLRLLSDATQDRIKHHRRWAQTHAGAGMNTMANQERKKAYRFACLLVEIKNLREVIGKGVHGDV